MPHVNPHGLERLGEPPEPSRSSRPVSGYSQQDRREMLAVSLCCLAVGVVGLIILLTGWLS